MPPFNIRTKALDEILNITNALALRLNVKGLINLQFAYKNGEVFVLEVNPRASRTIPFVSKTTNTPLARIASQLAIGVPLSSFDLDPWDNKPYTAVKEAVLPFNKFPEESIFLSPEMKSTGEVMGISKTLGDSFRRALISAGNKVPTGGNVFISVNEKDKVIYCTISSIHSIDRKANDARIIIEIHRKLLLFDLLHLFRLIFR